MSGWVITGVVAAVVAYGWMLLATAVLFHQLGIDAEDGDKNDMFTSVAVGLLWPMVWFAITASLFAEWIYKKRS